MPLSSTPVYLRKKLLHIPDPISLLGVDTRSKKNLKTMPYSSVLSQVFLKLGNGTQCLNLEIIFNIYY